MKNHTIETVVIRDPLLDLSVKEIMMKQMNSKILILLLGTFFLLGLVGCAKEEAVLQAMTIAFTSFVRRKRMICSEKRITVSFDLLPYGRRAVSPK